MLWAETLILLATVCLLSTGTQLAGGKQPLTSEDFTSDQFGELVKQANHQCNLAGNQEEWYIQEAILGGTKQIVSGVSYEFHLRQRKTGCAREEMLKRNPNESTPLCVAQENATVIVCSVKLWHQSWINSTEITVRDIWFVDAGDGGISETVRLVNETNWELERALIQDAVRIFNTLDDKPHIYKLSGATEKTRKHKGEETKILEATLKETACPNVKDQLESLKKHSCYNNETKNEVRCTLPINKETLKNTRFLECEGLMPVFRGMWRASLHNSRKVAPGCLDLNGTSDESGSVKVGIIKMKNFARSDLRVLSADEINDTPFQELLKRVIVKYNNASKHDHLYKFKKLSDGRTEQCQVTVTTAPSDDGANETVAFDHCKSVARFMGYLLGGKQHVKTGTLSHKTALAIAEQAVWRYNSQGNDLREYRLETVQNMASKVVSGYRYMMNITMKAVSCKNTNDSTCLDPSKMLKSVNSMTEEDGFSTQDYLHCAVSAHKKPAAHEHEINITNCWRHVISTLATTWTYSYLSPEELLQLQGGDALKTVMETYNVLNKHMEESEIDYLSDGLKITKYKCDVILIRQKDQPERRRLGKCIEKPPTASKIAPLGGPREISAEQQRRPEFRIKIKNAVRRFNNMANDMHYHRLLRVESPVTQHATVCSVKVWSKPWENFTQIDIRDCQLSAMESPILVQSISDDVQATDEFKELVSHVTLMFNLDSSEKMLYRSHLIDGIIRDNFARCRVKVVEFDKGATVQLSNCEYVYFGEHRLRRPLHGWEQATALFQEVVGRAVNVFNTRVDSRYWYKLFAIEDPTTEHISGPQYTFTLYMLREACRNTRSVNGSNQDGLQELCEESKPQLYFPALEDDASELSSHFCLDRIHQGSRVSSYTGLLSIRHEERFPYMVSCHVRYWQRLWVTFHETIDVSDCELIPITQKTSSNEHQTTMVDRKQSQESNLQCISSQDKRWLKLFADQVNLGKPYWKVAIEEIEESPVPGKRLTFEVYFKSESTGEDCSESNEEACSNDMHFYVCKGSYWWKNWKNEETFEISQCKNVTRFKAQTTTTKGASAHGDMELKEMVSKAVELYNEKLADFYIFGEDSVQNVLLENRVQCSVTVWQRPWLGENERIWLHNCHDSYSYPSSAGVHQISDEEENSNAFKDAVKRLGEMYTTDEPIIYSVKHENATAQQNATQRLIRLVLILEPVGCDYTKPNSNSPACRDWRNQDKVKCLAEIVQELSGISHRVLRLTGCSPIMEPIPERLLKPSEYETVSFKRTLRKAWELFHQLMRQSGQLFNVVDVKDGTIERDTEQKIKYTATFEETICIRGIDDYRFEGVYSSDCSRKTPHVLRNCEVKVTTNEKGEHVAVSCTSY
ncbi:hypothetical protein X801_00854 [Opisthorchis viverrini]|uniref:Cystatin domain protein n=1 Tax=Opisthorchis viverrini TaxID=6198 RepID=A0A1S8X922_OPIVI|nr:hypothetical protein X801_00854 [Opisthorchis viverrini]